MLTNLLRRSTTAAFLAAALIAAGEEPCSKMKFWQTLEDELVSVFNERSASLERPFDAFLHSTQFASIAKTNDLSLWREMAAQADYPLIALGGYLCIEKHKPELAVPTAMDILINVPQKQSVMLFGVLLTKLRETAANDENIDAFTRLSRGARRTQANNFSLIIAALPDRFLYSWFHDDRSKTALISNRAMVLGDLFGTTDANLKPTIQMKSTLNDFATIPGQPRLTYVWYTKRRDAYFKERLLEVIEDQAILDVEVAALLTFQIGRDFVTRHLKLTELNITPERRKLLEEWLDRKRDD